MEWEQMSHDEIDEFLEQEIARFEREQLYNVEPPVFDLETYLNDIEFIRINGLACFWDNGTNADFIQHVINFVISSHIFEKEYLTFVITGDEQQTRIFVGGKSASTTKDLLYSAFPGIQLSSGHLADLGTKTRTRFRYSGMISGIPSNKLFDKNGLPGNHSLHIEHVIRGMRKDEWAFIVKAYPTPKDSPISNRKNLLNDANRFASIAKTQRQRTVQTTGIAEKNKTQSIADVIGGEIINRRANYLVELVDKEIKRADDAISVGQWQVATYFTSLNREACLRLGALLRGTFSGNDSGADPIRLHYCSNSSMQDEGIFHTLLTSNELARWIALPRAEMPGFNIRDWHAFDVDFRPTADQDLKLGKIVWQGDETEREYSIKSNDLTRHAIVLGVTGSGKTTSIFKILSELSARPKLKPFLVIEPAKTEYRSLLGQIDAGVSQGPVPNLRVYTLGNDSVAPFRLNPFEFETDDEMRSAAVLSHIDFLKAVFNAAFILYAPMPYVLEIALHEIYEDKGWNLATGKNFRLSHQQWKDRAKFPIFPTLTDLYNKIEVITSRLGYESRIEQDVIAGLKARIGSLRLGSKGLMLDTPRGIPISKLLSKPTVLELEKIGNDDEKTFIMGLLFTQIFSHYRLEAEKGALSDELKHILVIEEAHRLLKNVNTSVEVEASNLRAQAIETFVNMLSEIRHYGQAVLVAEQIPSKLTPDVIKNTNLKLIHRLVAKDDRELVGATMNLSDEQSRFFSLLERGQALVYAEGDDHPYHIHMPNVKHGLRASAPSDKALLGLTEQKISLSPYLPVINISSYDVDISSFSIPDQGLYQTVSQILNRQDIRIVLPKIIARILYHIEVADQAIEQLIQIIHAQFSSLGEKQLQQIIKLVIVLGFNQEFQERGVTRGWGFSSIEEMRSLITTIAFFLPMTKQESQLTLTTQVTNFFSLYSKHTEQKYGPYPGCKKCQEICLFATDVQKLLSKLDVDNVASIFRDTQSELKFKYQNASSAIQNAVDNWLAGKTIHSAGLAYCTSLTIADRLGLDEYMQADFSDRIFFLINPEGE